MQSIKHVLYLQKIEWFFRAPNAKEMALGIEEPQRTTFKVYERMMHVKNEMGFISKHVFPKEFYFTRPDYQSIIFKAKLMDHYPVGDRYHDSGLTEAHYCLLALSEEKLQASQLDFQLHVNLQAFIEALAGESQALAA